MMAKAAEGVSKEGFENGDTAGWALRGDGEGTLTAEQNSDMAGSWVGLIETAQPDPGNKGKSVTAYREFDGTLSAGMTLQALVSFTQRQPGHVPQMRYVDSAGIGSGQRNQFRLRFDPPANNVWCQVERGENVNRNDFATANAPNTVYKVVFTLHSDSIGCELFDSSGDRLAATTVKHPPEFTYNTIDRVEVQNRESVDIRFDEVSVPTGDTGTKTRTRATPSKKTLRDGRQTEIRVQHGEGVSTYYVVHSIPGWEDHRRAVTTTDYELVGLWPTRDALWVEHYVSFQSTDIILNNLKKRRDTVEQRRETYEIRRHGQRVSEFLMNTAQIIALVKSSGSYAGALGEMVDMVTDLVTWTQADDAYEKAFTSMAHSATNINWAKDEAAVTRNFDEEAEHLLETATQFNTELIDFLGEAPGQAGTATDVYKAFDDFWGQYDSSMGLFHGNIDASKINKYGQQIAVGLVLGALDEYVEGYFRAEARHAAVMAALYTVELPIIDTLIGMLEDIKNGRGNPGQLLRYHIYQFTLYQLAAQGNEYASGILENQGGPMVWLNQATPDAESLSKRAEKHRQWAADNRNYAAFEFAKIGGTHTDVDERVDQSLNTVFAEQGVEN